MSFHLKILNYGRIYGAGQRYAKQLLVQFNHRLTEEDAEMKAAQLFKSTKGTIRYELTEYGHELAEQHDVTVNPSGSNDAKVFREILRKARIYREKGKKCWLEKMDKWKHRGNNRFVLVDEGWSGALECIKQTKLKKMVPYINESEIFNKLEDIAVSNEPRTPVLNCKISRALDPNVVRVEKLVMPPTMVDCGSCSLLTKSPNIASMKCMWESSRKQKQANCCQIVQSGFMKHRSVDGSCGIRENMAGEEMNEDDEDNISNE
eukprot:gene10213-11263_t